MVRAALQEPKRSLPVLAEESLSSVSVTLRAFLEKKRVVTITRPAATSQSMFTCCCTSARPLILSVARSPPAARWASASSMEVWEAMNTPMKFTRSLPAKARASAPVPASTVMRRVLILSPYCRMAAIIVQATKAIRMAIPILASTISMNGPFITGLVFRPLNTAK